MNMDEDIIIKLSDETGVKRLRPILLTVLCLFSFVYFGLLSLFFLAGLFNAGWITNVTNQYLTAGDYTKARTLFIFGAGFLLHCIAFTGILLIWKMLRRGFYFLGLSCLVIASYQLFNPVTEIASTAIYILLILLFGLFYRRMY